MCYHLSQIFMKIIQRGFILRYMLLEETKSASAARKHFAGDRIEEPSFRQSPLTLSLPSQICNPPEHRFQAIAVDQHEGTTV